MEVIVSCCLHLPSQSIELHSFEPQNSAACNYPDSMNNLYPYNCALSINVRAIPVCIIQKLYTKQKQLNKLQKCKLLLYTVKNAYKKKQKLQIFCFGGHDSGPTSAKRPGLWPGCISLHAENRSKLSTNHRTPPVSISDSSHFTSL